ncbi:hypothetical protein HPP92_012570 [Vanilla planifolia]|uniref:Uncharacterized protein n=1 Tax=Vanilla planifolia TaxID=51239 RepID=A0A835UZT0_VANPL|nr:hypothetical protein HPP92_012570 [Vanilla planifolia]
MEIEKTAGERADELTVRSSDTLVGDGAVDFRGKLADKITTGGWRAASFIIVNEVAERMAFYAIAFNMVIFLVKEMHEDLPDASTNVTNWGGTAFVLTLLGAFLADAYLGRFLTIAIFSCFYAAGTVLLTLAASMDSLRPPPCSVEDCRQATGRQKAFLFASLYLIALGTGGIKPCVSSFGADQFDEEDPGEARKKNSFFNWFFFAINLGVVISITLVSYVENRKGWGCGFGISAAGTLLSLVILLAGWRLYRHQRPHGSAFSRFLQVLIAACRNYASSGASGEEALLFELKTELSAIHGMRKLPHTNQYTFLDRAAVMTAPVAFENRWKLCTVTQVEEFKSFVRVLPIWLTTIAFPFAAAHVNLFTTQAMATNRRLSTHFVVPASSVAVFSVVNGLIVIPLYELYGASFFRRFTGHPHGFSSLQRVGLGMFVTIPTFVVAALVERHRRRAAEAVTFWWLLPQYFMLGFADAFTFVGQLEFFYNEATDGTKSISSALFLSTVGVGNWMTSLSVKVVERATGGKERGWLRKDLNHSKLDYYYWIVCAICAVNFCVYLVVASYHKGKDQVVIHSTTGEDESSGTKRLIAAEEAL